MNLIQKDRETRTRLNIVHLITTIERGGAENQLLILCKQQIVQGHNVTIYFLKGNPELQSDFEKNGTLVSNRLADKNFLIQVILMRFTRMNGTTIFHAHLPQAEMLLKFGLSRGKHKCISRHYGGQFYPKIPNFYSVLLSRMITWNIPIIIAPSKFTSDYLHDSKEISKKKKIELVTYGFSKEDFLNQHQHDKNSKKDLQSRMTIGTVGRLSKEKDYPTILKALARVVSASPNVNLKIVGVGPLENQLKKFAEDLGVSDSIEWLGKTDKIASFMCSLEIFVLASKFEGFGMVLLEAMASNIKIIASDAPTCIEVLGQDGAASFFPRGDHEKLAQLILKKLEQPDNSFLEREKSLHKYDIKTSAKAIEGLYYSLIPNNGRIFFSQD